MCPRAGRGVSIDRRTAVHLAAQLLSSQVGVVQHDLDGPEALAADDDFADEVALAVIGQRELRTWVDPCLDHFAARVAPHLDVHPAIDRRRRATSKQALEKVDHTPHSVSQAPMLIVSPTSTPARSSASNTPRRSSCFCRWAMPSSLLRSVMATSRSTRLPRTRYTPSAAVSTLKPSSSCGARRYTRTSCSRLGAGGSGRLASTALTASSRAGTPSLVTVDTPTTFRCGNAARRRSRPSRAPGRSSLLAATSSGFAATSGLYASSSRRTVR